MRRLERFRGDDTVNLFRLFLHFPGFVRLYWRLFRDRRVPLYLKLILLFTLFYVISPVDLIPEIFNPVLGVADDLALLLIALKYFVKLAPKDVVAEHIESIEGCR